MNLRKDKASRRKKGLEGKLEGLLLEDLKGRLEKDLKGDLRRGFKRGLRNLNSLRGTKKGLQGGA